MGIELRDVKMINATGVKELKLDYTTVDGTSGQNHHPSYLNGPPGGTTNIPIERDTSELTLGLYFSVPRCLASLC